MTKNLMFVVYILILLISATQADAQSLFNERIRKITPVKKSVFIERGIFHNGNAKEKSVLNQIRHSFNKELNVERIVFDFESKKIPRIYGHMDSGLKKIYIDIYQTKLNPKIGLFGTSKLVKGVDFFNLSEDMLSLELNLNAGVSADIFYLENPARLVIDLKK